MGDVRPGSNDQAVPGHRTGLIACGMSVAAVLLCGVLLRYAGWIPALLTFIAASLGFAVAFSRMAERLRPAPQADPSPKLRARVLTRARLD